MIEGLGILLTRMTAPPPAPLPMLEPAPQPGVTPLPQPLTRTDVPLTRTPPPSPPSLPDMGSNMTYTNRCLNDDMPCCQTRHLQ